MYPKEKMARLKGLYMEPVYLVPLKKTCPRKGWYIAAALTDGLDLYRGGCGYISYKDCGVLYDVYLVEEQIPI